MTAVEFEQFINIFTEDRPIPVTSKIYDLWWALDTKDRQMVLNRVNLEIDNKLGATKP